MKLYVQLLRASWIARTPRPLVMWFRLLVRVRVLGVRLRIKRLPLRIILGVVMMAKRFFAMAKRFFLFFFAKRIYRADPTDQYYGVYYQSVLRSVVLTLRLTDMRSVRTTLRLTDSEDEDILRGRAGALRELVEGEYYYFREDERERLVRQAWWKYHRESSDPVAETIVNSFMSVIRKVS